jgi:thiamine-phosphate pyrophosphorylase
MRRRSLLRVVDANANRALEGLRVCEDLARFYLDSARLFARCRRLRHAIAAAVRGLPMPLEALVRARASGGDVGRRARGGVSPSVERTLLMNLQRTKESLRVLEECARIVAPTRTAAFQRLRFRTYGVERELVLALAALRHR